LIGIEGMINEVFEIIADPLHWGLVFSV